MRLIYILTVSLICFPFIIKAQITGNEPDKSFTIKGYVITKDQQPVKGAVFYLDDQKTKSVSKSNGSYKIKTNAPTNKLTVVTPENERCDTSINGQATINFIFSGSNLFEKVVPSEKNKSLKGRSDTVNRKEMGNKVNIIETDKNQSRIYPSIFEMLKGTVPGVVVNGKNIIIRGPSSFTSSTQPLFVVDGMVVYTIDDINPTEVSSIEVVKSSSAGKYGYRGSNGVIVITTTRNSGSLNRK